MQHPLTITECRTTEHDGRPFLHLRVVGPQRVLFGKARGELTFYYEGYKLLTTHGKGATHLESIDHMTMVENEGHYELQAEMKPNNDSGTKTTLRRIATTESRIDAVTIWRALAEIGFPLNPGMVF